jgi:hypothetical protein
VRHHSRPQAHGVRRVRRAPSGPGSTSEGRDFQIGIEVKSGSLRSLIPDDHESYTLSLWRFELRPPSD